MIKTVGVDRAEEKQWKLGILEGEEGNNEFFNVCALYDGIHTFAVLPDLSTDFTNVPVNGYVRQFLQCILVYSIVELNDFPDTFVNRRWYKSDAHIGSIADECE